MDGCLFDNHPPGTQGHLDNGKSYVVDRMNDKKLHIRPGNNEWTMKKIINVNEGHCLVEKGRDIICFRTTVFRPQIGAPRRLVRKRRRRRRRRRRIWRRREESLKWNAGPTAAKSAMEDVARGKEVDYGRPLCTVGQQEQERLSISRSRNALDQHQWLVLLGLLLPLT